MLIIILFHLSSHVGCRGYRTTAAQHVLIHKLGGPAWGIAIALFIHKELRFSMGLTDES